MDAYIKEKYDENGDLIYLVTSSAAVGMSDGSGNLDTKLSELDAINGFSKDSVQIPDYDLLEGTIQNGSVVVVDNYSKHTSPISLIKGQAIVVRGSQARSKTPFWITDASGSYYINSGVKSITDSQYDLYSNVFVANENCYVSVAAYVTPSMPLEIFLVKNGIYNTLMRVTSDRLEDGSVSTNKLADKAVEISKLSQEALELIVTSYEKSDFNDGFYFSLDNGLKVSNDSFSTFGPIKIVDKEHIYVTLRNSSVSSIGNIVYFRKDNTYISGVNIPNTTWGNKRLTDIPEEAYYIGFTTLKIHDEAKIVLSSKLTSNSVSEDKIEDGAVSTNKLADSAVTSNKIKDSSVSLNKLSQDVLDIIQPSVQYYREDFEDDFYFRLETGAKLPNSSYACLGPIQIEDRDNIYVTLRNGNITVIGNIVYFRKDNSFISGINIPNTSWVNRKLTDIPEDAYYIGFSEVKSQENAMVSMGLKISTDKISNGAVTEDKLAEDSVTTDKIAEKSVTKNKLADDALFQNKYEAFIKQGNFNSNEYILLPQIHINKNILLTVAVDGIPNIEFGVGYSNNPTYLYREYNASFFRIDGNTISLFYYNNETELKPAVWSDTITIPLDNHTVCTIVSNIETIDKTTLRIYNSKGDVQTFEIERQWGVGQPYIQNKGVETLFAKIAFMPRDLNNDIWAFGDSYISFISDARWPKYMRDYGFTNWLCNNQPGLSPQSGVTDLESLLSLGYRPTYIVWFLGMNGDTQESKVEGEYVINTYQKTQLDKMIKLCVDNNITSIIATMPTTPATDGSTDDSGLSNEAGRIKIGYSNYVRSLHYRYIDFEKAVGTDEFGNWTEGLLSSDKVHPSSKGAIVLVSQVLIDAPELSKNYN